MSIKAISNAQAVNSRACSIIKQKLKEQNLTLEHLSINDVIKSSDIYEIRNDVKNFDIKMLCAIGDFIGYNIIKDL